MYGEPYASLAEMKDRFDIVDDDDDDKLERAITAASTGVDRYCRRQFNRGAAPEEREYDPIFPGLLFVDDIHDLDGLLIDGAPLDTAAVRPEPIGGLRDGVPGWPYWKLRSRGRTGPRWSGPVRVTAWWGWAAVPAPVREATAIAASEIFKTKDAPFGVAGWNDFGIITVRENPQVKGLLNPYRRKGVRIA
ncbi:hypothetical protein GCM10027160_29000 [Streptomyces calidiresistens]|uniref:Uncharacterized protein n=1 Tax=Streptomyces calidiresistens TaxID=1485586 RepID=A0A7W3XV74_9ACTN|nr:phage head-tail connector protein [Streptomyces calidiresistens]MBB0228518.1 hypothetical protein [Streptomyces calidiresistens]